VKEEKGRDGATPGRVSSLTFSLETNVEDPRSRSALEGKGDAVRTLLDSGRGKKKIGGREPARFLENEDETGLVKKMASGRATQISV